MRQTRRTDNQTRDWKQRFRCSRISDAAEIQMQQNYLKQNFIWTTESLCSKAWNTNVHAAFYSGPALNYNDNLLWDIFFYYYYYVLSGSEVRGIRYALQQYQNKTTCNSSVSRELDEVDACRDWRINALSYNPGKLH